ncbi:MAG: 3'(2'),5'-bisphosphate nucleotidase CysQ [Leptonema sp. (in: bacteria)]
MIRISDTFIEEFINLSLQIKQIQKEESFDVSYKDIKSKDPLTSADLYANEFLKELLKKEIPESLIVSEESPLTNERFSCETVWMIDPIDGTRDFIAKKNTFSISVGLLYKNHPLFGIVSMPAENYLVYGYNHPENKKENYLCKIEFSNSKPLKKQIKSEFHYETKELEEAKILVSESEKNKNKLKQLPKTWNLVPTGSVARKLALIAWGEADLMISLNPKNEWDVCAGIALIYGSNQIASTLEYTNGVFKQYFFNKENLNSLGLVAGNPHLVEKYLIFHKNNKIQVFNSY